MTHQASTTRRDMLKLAGRRGLACCARRDRLPALARAAAPMLGVAAPSIYRFKLGSFEVTNILDGYVQGNGPHPTFGNNQTGRSRAGLCEVARAAADQDGERLRQHAGEHGQGARSVRRRQRQGRHADRRQAAPICSSLPATSPSRSTSSSSPTAIPITSAVSWQGGKPALPQRALRLRRG